MTSLLFIGFIFLCFHLYRQHITNKALSAPSTIDFEGDVYSVAETVFAIRKQGLDSDKTIVCFPGFTETMSYFVELYKDENVQLILVNNALYHSPFDLSDVTELSWQANPYDVGTIAYDGFHLARIVKDFATGSSIFVHGHSRGGAVVLDAGRQFPEIMRAQGKTVTALLEAAVVPKGTTIAPNPGKFGRMIMAYLMPLFFHFSANISREKLEKMPMMKPTNPLKTAEVMRSFKSPKFYWVYLVNVINIPEWQAEQSYALYENFHKVVLIQGSRDDVLVNQTMEASALEGARLNDQVQILKTKETNHFISLEQPHYIRDLVAGKNTADI